MFLSQHDTIYFRWGDAFQDAFSEPVNNASKPKEQKSANDPFSGQGRYTGLDFYEDPFKNSNYRYADPFDENSNSDPFNDPFTASESDVFGSDPFSNSAISDQFKNNDKNDPFAAPTTENTYENSSLANKDPFGKGDSDPFSSKPGADPFGNSFTANFNSAPNMDPFGSNNNFGSSNDPFSLTNLKTTVANTSAADFNSNSSKPTVSSTNSTISYRKEKNSTEPATVIEKSSKKKSSHSLSDFLTGSPLKSDKGDKSKEKKEKKHGKFHLTSPLKHKKSAESPKPDKKNKNHGAGEAAADEVSFPKIFQSKSVIPFISGSDENGSGAFKAFRRRSQTKTTASRRSGFSLRHSFEQGGGGQPENSVKTSVILSSLLYYLQSVW